MEAIANGDPQGRRAPRRALDLALGGDGADGGVPLDGHDRAVRHLDADGRRAPVHRRDRPDLLKRPKPRTGSRYAVTGIAQPGYQRLLRTIAVPAGGAKLSLPRHARHAAGRRLLLRRGAHGGRRRLDDAARPAATTRSDVTTFDCAGRAASCTRSSRTTCAPSGRDCRPRGTTGSWQAASLAERRRRALGRRPLALRRPQRRGRAQLRDRRRSSSSAGSPSTTSSSRGAAGSTSFEDDGDTLDGWTVPGAPRRQRAERRPTGPRHGRAGPRTAATSPQAAVAREPEIARLPRGRLRAVSVLGRRLDHRRPADRLRAREPDAPDLLAGLLRGPRRRRGRHA